MQNKKQLQEFADLLLELQCAKNDGRIKGLQILDEPAYLGETYRRQAPCWPARKMADTHLSTKHSKR